MPNFIKNKRYILDCEGSKHHNKKIKITRVDHEAALYNTIHWDVYYELLDEPGKEYGFCFGSVFAECLKPINTQEHTHTYVYMNEER